MATGKGKTGENPGNAAADTPTQAQGAPLPGVDDQTANLQAEAKSAEQAKPAPVAEPGEGDRLKSIPEQWAAQFNTETPERQAQIREDWKEFSKIVGHAAEHLTADTLHANYLALSPDEQEKAKALISRVPEGATQAASSLNLAPIDDQQRAANLKVYGPGHVVARKGKLQTIFTAEVWKNLGENKEGWQPVVATPPEVIQLQNKKLK